MLCDKGKCEFLTAANARVSAAENVCKIAKEFYRRLDESMTGSNDFSGRQNFVQTVLLPKLNSDLEEAVRTWEKTRKEDYSPHDR